METAALWLLTLLLAGLNAFLLATRKDRSNLDIWVGTQLFEKLGPAEEAAGIEAIGDDLVVVMKDGREFYLSLVIEEKKETL